MSVITSVAFWGGIGLCIAVVALAVVLVLWNRYSAYEGAHRFDDDDHVISDAPPPHDFPVEEDA